MKNELWCGDCLDLMKKIDDNSIDMILCDLPFGTTECKWDNVIDLSLLWEQYNRICKDNAAILLFAQTPFDKVLGCSNLKMLRYEWIWEKPKSTGFLNAKKMPLKAHENILVFYNKLPIFNPQKTTGHKLLKTTQVARKGPCEVYNKIDKPYTYEGSTERFPRSVIEFHHDSNKSEDGLLHPTQKPLLLCEYFIKTYSNEGDLILDNTCGSGTTLVAAKKLYRQYIGIEKEQKYIDVAKKRLNKIVVF